MEELKDIAKRRKRLGLKQTELAKLAGVSQSLIAKLERGLIDVAYSKAKKIFSVLESVEKKEQLTAAELMTKKIISISKNESIAKATEIMEKFGISQLPVFEGKRCTGSISEEGILKEMQKEEAKYLKKMPVESIMEEGFPILSLKSGINEINALLQRNQAVLVTEKGNIIGIITKADLLKAISK